MSPATIDTAAGNARFPTPGGGPGEQRIAHLRSLYDDALTRQAAADHLARRLAAAIDTDGEPGDAERLFAQALAAAAQAADAGDEAAAYAEQAEAILSGLSAAAPEDRLTHPAPKDERAPATAPRRLARSSSPARAADSAPMPPVPRPGS